MKLSEKIVELRKMKGMTQEELASVCNVSRQSVSKWEADIALPELDKLLILSDIFQISVDVLVKDELLIHGVKDVHSCGNNALHEKKEEVYEGVLEDLTDYADRSFDLVMSFDAPISYTYPKQEEVIGNLVRIARKRLMISVSSRLGALPYLANPLQKHQFILDKNSKNDWIQWCLKNRDKMIDSFKFSRTACENTYTTGFMGDVEEVKQVYDRGEAPWCITYHFMPDELMHILHQNGVGNIELAGPGAFARTIPNEILVKIMNDPEQKREFLDFCHEYDRNPYVCGMGKDNLFAKGEIL